MKNFKTIIAVTCLVLVGFFQSCNDDGFTDEVKSSMNSTDISWMATTRLNIQPNDEDRSSFVWVINAQTLKGQWGNKTIDLDVNIESASGLNQIRKIDFYAVMQEEDGYNYSAPFDTEGKLIESVDSWDQEGYFKLTLSAEELYNLFINDLQYDRSELLPRMGDLFEIHSVIHNVNGELIDSRSTNSRDSRYAVTSDIKIVDTWSGEFEATWIEVGSGTVRWSYTGVTLGAKRPVVFKPAAIEGQYDVNDLACGGAYGAPRGGTFAYDSGTNTLTRVAVETYYQSKWEVVSVTEDVLTILWTSRFTSFNADGSIPTTTEYGVFELRRDDGLTWPLGLTIVNN